MDIPSCLVGYFGQKETNFVVKQWFPSKKSPGSKGGLLKEEFPLFSGGANHFF